MRKLVAGWADSARGVGVALLDVWRAEVETLRGELRSSGKDLGRGLVLLAVAGVFGFWTVGVGLWTAVEALSLELPRWMAGLAVFGAGLLLTLIVVWLAKRRLARVEQPLRLVRRRGREHAEWWRENVMPQAADERGEESPSRDEQADDF